MATLDWVDMESPPTPGLGRSSLAWLPAPSAVRPSDDFQPGMPYSSSATWSFRTLRCTVWPDTPAILSALT